MFFQSVKITWGGNTDMLIWKKKLRSEISITWFVKTSKQKILISIQKEKKRSFFSYEHKVLFVRLSDLRQAWDPKLPKVKVALPQDLCAKDQCSLSHDWWAVAGSTSEQRFELWSRASKKILKHHLICTHFGFYLKLISCLLVMTHYPRILHLLEMVVSIG